MRPNVESIVTSATPEQVWAILEDGWSYAAWVVGASRIRDVSERWPEQGTLIHHSVGLWPLLVDDETEVTDDDRPHRLRLTAKTRPLGTAFIELRIREVAGGTEIEMVEDATSGPGLAIPRRARQALLSVRNREVLRRLALLAERAAPLQ